MASPATTLCPREPDGPGEQRPDVPQFIAAVFGGSADGTALFNYTYGQTGTEFDGAGGAAGSTTCPPSWAQRAS